MRVLALVGIAVLSASISTAALASVAGKTVKYTNSHGQTYWTTYNKNGTSFTKSTTRDGTGYMHDIGHWRYVNGVLCERYNNWQGGREFCR